MKISGYTAGELFAIFSRVFGGRKSPFALYSRTLSGKAVYRRACRSCLWADMGQPDCAHCKNDDFRTLAAEDILNHIGGRAATGIYPVGENGLCRFSVIEIGGPAPGVALKSLSMACDVIGAACLREICDFGQGARLWIFFGRDLSPAAAVYAAVRVIEEAALISGPELLSLADSILPVPAGGFGRPVVLPLFDINSNCSFFLDDDFQPVDDPMALLEDLAPPAADFSFPELTPPARLKVEVCGSIYISAGVDPSVLLALCRAASFLNPRSGEFSRTPPLERCYDIVGGRLILPRGIDLAALLPETKLRIKNSSAKGSRMRFRRRKKQELTSWQSEALAAALKLGGGVITAPLGSGKTAVVAELIRRCARSTLILVPDRITAKRWRRIIGDLFVLRYEEVGLVLDDRDYPTGCLDIAVLNPSAELRLTECIAQYGLVIVADCDRLSCAGKDFRSLMEAVCAERVFAISARDAASSRLGPYIRLYCGKTIYRL